MKVIARNSTQIVPEFLRDCAMPVFGLDGRRGVECVKHSIKAAPGVELWCIAVGEEGRGRWRSVILVDRPEIDGDKRMLRYARLAETRSGAPKLVSAQTVRDAQYCIVRADLGIGFRGSNSFTGERIAEREWGASPWIPIAIGEIAQGDAGRMGSGTQMVAALSRGVVARVATSGRTAASAYYYFDGWKLHVRTWDERVQLADVEGDVFPLSPAMNG